MDIKKMKILSVIAVVLLSLTACKKEGPLEKAGSKVDEIGDNLRDGDPPLKKKGPLEKAGEAVDDTVDGDK